jgi:NADH:ubiquinone oxidoreductase subunit C
VDTGEILNKLKQAAPGGVLEKSRFGRSSHLSLWVEAKSLPRIAAFLKADAEIGLDWLENLSAIQMDESLVVTYFLRSTKQSHTLILRVSVVPASAAREADLPSVAGTWAMATPFEIEIQELFGIRFTTVDGGAAHDFSQRLPKGWNGYPLRKSYVFPTEFLGIAHSRKAPVTGGNA